VTALLVALGAAVGAPARLLAARVLDRGTHWGTLAVNLAGSALLGWLVGRGVGEHATALLATGFCGAFTTYSAVAVQSVDRGGWRGLAYAVATVVLCLGTAAAGYALGG
jgi:CrcB protein